MANDAKALPVVAYVESWPDDRQAFGMQPLVEWRDLPEGTRLVRQSDAELALAELRAEVERADREIGSLTGKLIAAEQRADTAEARLERVTALLQEVRMQMLHRPADNGYSVLRIDAFLGEGK